MAEPLGAPFFTALDTTGVALSGAVLEFYQAGTSTPATVYGNSTLTTSLGSTVTADSAGRFGDIWLTPTAAYKAILKSAAGATIRTIDPVATAASGVFLTASSNLSDLGNVATARTNLGLTIGTGGATVPLLNGANTWSALQSFSAGAQVSGADVATVSGTQTLTNKTISGGISSARSAAGAETTGTLTNASANRIIQLTGDITINNNVFAKDDVIVVYAGGSQRTITKGTITNLRLDGTSQDGNRTVAARGMGFLYFVSATECVVGGGGVS